MYAIRSYYDAKIWFGAAPPDLYKELKIDTRGEFGGLGIVITSYSIHYTKLYDSSVVDGPIQSLNKLETFYTLPTATFDLAKTLTDTEILASPKIRVRNGEKAKVHIGSREPVITVTNTIV